MPYVFVEYFCGVHNCLERFKIRIIKRQRLPNRAMEPIYSKRNSFLKALKVGEDVTEQEVKEFLNQHFLKSSLASKIMISIDPHKCPILPNYSTNSDGKCIRYDFCTFRRDPGCPAKGSTPLRITKNPGGENKEMPSEREYKEIPIDLIESATTPSREEFSDLDSLASTIKRHGLLEPILVRKKDKGYGWEVIVGERRLRACRKAGLNQVPCLVVDGVSEEQILQMQIVENVQRTDLKVFEEIKIVQNLKNHYELSDEEIAVKTGLSHGTVQNYLTIAKGLPQEYIKIISHGSHSPTDLTITKALILARANLPADQLKEIVELIQRTGISTQNLAKKLAQRPSISKIKRVRESRGFWQELTKTLRSYASYWSDYCQIREWEDVESYHLELRVSLPKDLKESEQN